MGCADDAKCVPGFKWSTARYGGHKMEIEIGNNLKEIMLRLINVSVEQGTSPARALEMAFKLDLTEFAKTPRPTYAHLVKETSPKCPVCQATLLRDMTNSQYKPIKDATKAAGQDIGVRLDCPNCDFRTFVPFKEME